MARFSSVIFDLDGTLIDSAPDLLAAANHILAEEGRPTLTLADIKMMVGDGVPRLVERAFAKTGNPAGKRLDGLTARFVTFYHKHAADETRPFPGVMEALATLKAMGLRLGICTNKPHRPAIKVLEALGLTPHFSAVIGGDTLPGIKKPDPRHVEACLDALGADALSSVMIGDSLNDVASGKAAGLPTIVYAHGYAKMDPAKLGPDAILDDFADLARMLETWD